MNFRVSDISDMWLLANWRIESGQLALHFWLLGIPNVELNPLFLFLAVKRVLRT
jgi:hypothetical protein